MKEEKTTLYGGISNSPEERAEIIYNHPDNKEKPLKIEIKRVEYVPIFEHEETTNLFQSNLGIIPKNPNSTEYPKAKYSKDLKQERKNKVNEIRLQQRNTYHPITRNPKERIDYINTPQQTKISSFGLNPDNPIQPEIKMESKRNLKPKKNYQEIAEAFYPEMEEKSQIRIRQNKKYDSQIEMPVKTQYENEKVSKSKRNKPAKDYEEIANVMYPNMPENPLIKKLKQEAKTELSEIEKERWLTHARNFGGAALMIGTAAIPAAKGIIMASQAGKTAVAYLTPIVGKYYAEKIAPMIIMDGIAGGGLFNLGHGMLTNKENLLIEMLNGAVIGMFTVPAMELALTKLLRYIPEDKLINYINAALKRSSKGVKYNKGDINNAQQRESTSEFIRRVRRIYKKKDEEFKAYEKRGRTRNGGMGTESDGRVRVGILGRINGLTGRLVENTYVPTSNFIKAFKTRGYKANIYHELKRNNDEVAKLFYNSLSNAKIKLNKKAATVYIYPKQEYKNMRLFLSEDKQSGFAIKDDGDIVSVFSIIDKQGISHSMLELAIQEGGTKLDCFDTYLPNIYKAHGFKEVKRVKWNEEYKPENWDKEYFSSFNNGEPDVVYFELEK